MKRKIIKSLQVMLMAVLLLLTMVGKPAIAQGGTSINTLLNDYTVAVATATVRTQKSNYAPNEPIIVEYSGFPGNTKDWITISSPSKPNNSYGQYFYTQGKQCGTRSFKGLPAGDYEVRGYFNWSTGDYTIQTRSNFTVGQVTSIQPEPQPVTQNCPQDNLIQPKPEPTPVAKPEPTPVAKPEPTPIAKPEPNPCDPNKPIPGAFTSIRIGDFDGFGFNEGKGLKAAYGGSINVDGSGTLSTGDFLPDFNGDGKISNRDAGDPFDNRSDAEVAGTFLTGGDFEDMGSKGSDYTDLSLGKAFGYKTSSTYGRPFPDGDPNTLPNVPGFKFRFKVAKNKLPEGTPLFLNVMLGDYDVEPAQVILKNGKGQSFTKELTASAKSEKDGIIQSSFVALEFSQVFTDGNTTGQAGYWVGSLDVNFDAPQEPFLSFDFAEIGTNQILLTPCAEPQPEPNPCDPNKPIPGAFSSIRLGDFDGFGFNEGKGLKAAYGGTINVDGTGTLSTGDFLPDFNGDGKISNRDAGDPFDNRSDAEVAGTFVTGSGFEDMGSKGVDYTDLSLGKVFAYKTSSTYGRPFPDGDPNTLPNTPGFKFRFKVAKDKLPEGTPLYLNVMLGDYDVEPAQVILKNGKGQSFTKELTASAKSEKDGIIQAAYLPLDFSQVFTDGNTSGETGYWVGSLDVNFDAPQEPYLSFDFAEIGTHQILLTPCPKS